MNRITNFFLVIVIYNCGHVIAMEYDFQKGGEQRFTEEKYEICTGTIQDACNPEGLLKKFPHSSVTNSAPTFINTKCVGDVGDDSLNKTQSCQTDVLFVTRCAWVIIDVDDKGHVIQECIPVGGARLGVTQEKVKALELVKEYDFSKNEAQLISRENYEICTGTEKDVCNFTGLSKLVPFNSKLNTKPTFVNTHCKNNTTPGTKVCESEVIQQSHCVIIRDDPSGDYRISCDGPGQPDGHVNAIEYDFEKGGEQTFTGEKYEICTGTNKDACNHEGLSKIFPHSSVTNRAPTFINTKCVQDDSVKKEQSCQTDVLFVNRCVWVITKVGDKGHVIQGCTPVGGTSVGFSTETVEAQEYEYDFSKNEVQLISRENHEICTGTEKDVCNYAGLSKLVPFNSKLNTKPTFANTNCKNNSALANNVCESDVIQQNHCVIIRDDPSGDYRVRCDGSGLPGKNSDNK